MSRSRTFSSEVTAAPRGALVLSVPFDPDEVWGARPVHLVHGTVAGMGFRASVEGGGGGRWIKLGPAWARDCGAGLLAAGRVEVVMAPEGPQRDDLAPDLAAALDASPSAAACFESLAQFYRNAYLRWIDATKRRPDVRAERIAEVVSLLEAGVKERPRP